jgi:uncharacterized membrane protein
MLVDHLKAVTKAVTWRLVGAADTFAVTAVTTFVATGAVNLKVATGVVGCEVLTKTFLYYLHERAWATAWLAGLFAKE